MDIEIITQRNAEYFGSPAVGRCHCGGDVELDGFTCTCDDCGRDYSRSGQELAPRSQWGEETGESLADILGVDGFHLEDPNALDELTEKEKVA